MMNKIHYSKGRKFIAGIHYFTLVNNKRMNLNKKNRDGTIQND